MSTLPLRDHDHETRRRLEIDPELATALAAVPIGANGLFDLTDIPATRAAVQAMSEAMSAAMSAAGTATSPSAVSVTEHRVPSPDGPDVSVWLHRPAAAHPLPVLVWFHAGGQVLGSAADPDPAIEALCSAVGCAVASVDYRLAPETPAPGAAEDGLVAYRWLSREAAALGLDPARIGIGGQSGGGGIAAAVALLIRDRGAAAPLFQTLTYPMLDDRNATPSSHEITDLGVWDRSTNVLAWQAILGDRVGAADLSPYCAPARAQDLRGLPPTFLAVGELDCFRDEDLDYAMRLRAQDVPMELHLYPGAYHAFDVFAPASALATSFRQTWHAYLSRAFAA